MNAALTVVGIGADGFDGLGGAARAAVRGATLLIGSARQLELLPSDATGDAVRRLPWPSPLEPLLAELVAGRHGDAVVLASGDPMLHGIGASIARRIEEVGDAAPAPTTLHVIPHPSAFALACARLGWAEHETELVSTVARAPETVARALQPGRRLVVYVTGADGAAQVARVLTANGFGPSRFVVLEQLGGARERIAESTAEQWGERAADPLHALAIEVRPAAGTRPLPLTPGLPDDAFDHDGQLTKRHVRAVTLATLAPMPGELLWDVGAGSGSIAIEWLRALAAMPAARPTRAIAFELDPARAARIAANAARLGVPQLTILEGRAPALFADALVGAPGGEASPGGAPSGSRATAAASHARSGEASPGGAPDAIFVGGGVTAPGLLEGAWHALRPGGRIAVNAVTLESQARLLAARAEHGGTLTQIAIAHAAPVGGFSGWRQQMAVVQWAATKEEEPQR